MRFSAMVDDVPTEIITDALGPGSAINMEYIIVEYSYGDGLYLYYPPSLADIRIKHCTFRKNIGSGVHVVRPSSRDHISQSKRPK